MNLKFNDTIAAISTPLSGEGGIGIVRLSGKDAIKIAARIFRCKSGKPSFFKSHTIHYGWILNADEVLLSVMRAPKTYTREDIVEISGHGGPIVLRKILDLCLSSGARLAEPGEFTKRAFLNGRIDLIKAEAVADLIRAKTDCAASLAANQIKGVLSTKINKMRKDIIRLAADIEAGFDYSEEDINFVTGKEISNTLRKIKNGLLNLLEISQKNKVFAGGARIAIVGKPNAGKSSLLNAILLEERAIVSPVAGTTRDVVSETINIGGIAATLMDTAGMKEHKAKKHNIQTLAINHARSALSKADISLFVVDSSRPPDKNDFRIAKIISELPGKTILILNKSDLRKNKRVKKGFPELVELLGSNLAAKTTCSALKNKGIDEIHKAILFAATSYKTRTSQDISENSFYVNSRQETSLKNTLKNINSALKLCEKDGPPELLVINLNDALVSISQIAGETTTEDILDSVFSRFCVGK